MSRQRGGNFPDERNSYLKISDTGGISMLWVGESHGFGQAFFQNTQNTGECLLLSLWIAAYLLGKVGSEFQPVRWRPDYVLSLHTDDGQ